MGIIDATSQPNIPASPPAWQSAGSGQATIPVPAIPDFSVPTIIPAPPYVFAESSKGETAPPDGIKLTGNGRKEIGNLKDLKDKKLIDVIKSRGGGGKQLHKIATDLQNLLLGEVANKAAAGDKAADTAMKIVKQANSKAQKYGGK